MAVFSFAIDFSSALALRFCRYAAANAFAHVAAPGPVGASHAIVSTCEFGGTVTVTCLASSYDVSELCIDRPAIAATEHDFTSCTSVSRFTSAPRVWVQGI